MDNLWTLEFVGSFPKSYRISLSLKKMIELDFHCVGMDSSMILPNSMEKFSGNLFTVFPM